MKRVTILIIALIATVTLTMAQSALSKTYKAELKSVELMSTPSLPNTEGQVLGGKIDVVINLSNPEFAGRAIVIVRSKAAVNEILQGVNVLFFVKEGISFYSIDEQESVLKGGVALVHLSNIQLSVEQVSVEVILFDQNGVEIGKRVQ